MIQHLVELSAGSVKIKDALLKLMEVRLADPSGVIGVEL